MCPNPMVSVIIPVYNVGKYLSQCLDSVVNQTYKNLEIICVNDGSTDGSPEILERCAAADPRVRIVSQANAGPSMARNAGLRRVTGKYILCVDGDDWIDLDTCEVAVRKAESEQADVVFWNYAKEYGNSSREVNIFGPADRVLDGKQELRDLHRRFAGLYGGELRSPEKANSIVPVWGKLYRSELVVGNSIEFVDTKIIGTCEDGLFNLYVFGMVKKAVYLNAAMSHYRKNNGSSLTKQYNSHLRERWKNLYRYMRGYIEERRLDPTFTVALNNRICLDIIGLGLNVTSADLTAGQKRKAIKEIISDAGYRDACRTLRLKWFPLHWKVFFGFAKYNIAWGVYLALLCISGLLNGRNR